MQATDKKRTVCMIPWPENGTKDRHSDSHETDERITSPLRHHVFAVPKLRHLELIEGSAENLTMSWFVHFFPSSHLLSRSRCFFDGIFCLGLQAKVDRVVDQTQLLNLFLFYIKQTDKNNDDVRSDEERDVCNLVDTSTAA
jgi:hypothetical protein